MKNKKKKRKKTVKIRYNRVLLSLIIFILLCYLISNAIKIPIKNIFISNNVLLSDQEIIDASGISDYPSIFSITSYGIEKKLEKNILIDKADVEINFTKVYIKVKENYPLFYDSNKEKIILKNKVETDEILSATLLVNYIPDNIYSDFLEAMINIDREIIIRMSEIKYDPNTVDEERFLITMNDGNYVYLTLLHFDKINNYVDIIKNFSNQKGILYLDSGEYFKVYE